MDKFDQAIIDALTENARCSIASIGERVGLSRTAVNDRIQRLQQNGEIEGFTVKLKQQLQSDQIAVYFQLTFSPFQISKIKPLLKKIPEIKAAHSLTGDTDLIVFVQAGSMLRINDIRECLMKLENLEKLQTFTALQRVL